MFNFVFPPIKKQKTGYSLRRRSKSVLTALIIGSLTIICGLITAGNLPAATPQEASREEESFYVAKKALEDGFSDVALGLFERFLNNYPQSQKKPEAELLIGQCYFSQNKFLEALSRFDGLLKERGAEGIKDACLYWIAEVHFRGNDFKAAAGYYKKIIDEFPNSTYRMHAYYSLGWALFELSDYNKAREYFKIVQDAYPNESLASDASFKIADCLYYLKDYTQLKGYLASYQKSYPNDKQRLSLVFFYLAEANYYLADYQSAIEQYRKVLDYAPDNKIQALSKLGLVWSYLKLDKYKEAEELISNIPKEYLEQKNLEAMILAKGVLYNQTERFSQALSAYQELIDSRPQHTTLVQAFIGKAEALYSLSRFSEAIDSYGQAFDKIGQEEISDDLIDKLHYGCGWAYLKEGEFKKAISEFQKVAVKSSDKIVKIAASCLVADAYVDLGEYEKAVESYDRILKDYPDSLYGDYIQYQIGITLLKMSNYDGAILAFKVLLNNFTKSKLLDDAFYSLGLTYFQKEDYNSSQEVFKKFIADFPESNLRKDAMYLSGTSLYNLDKFSEAIEVFKEIIRLYGEDIQIVQRSEYEIADCLYRMGSEEEAVSRFKSLRSKYPYSNLAPEVVWWLGEYYYRQANFDLARRYFLAIIQDFPRSNLVSDAYYALGSTYEEEGDDKKALECFNKVIGIAEPDLTGQASVAIGDIFVKRNEYDSALKSYEETIKKYPNLSALLYPKIAEIYKRQGRYTLAIEFYRKSMEIAPLRQTDLLQFKIAESLQEQGKVDEAIEEYLKLTYLYPEDKSLVTKSLLRVGQIYEDREKFKEAKNIYDKVASMDVDEAKYARERIEWIEKNTRIK